MIKIICILFILAVISNVYSREESLYMTSTKTTTTSSTTTTSPAIMTSSATTTSPPSNSVATSPAFKNPSDTAYLDEKTIYPSENVALPMDGEDESVPIRNLMARWFNS